MVQDKKASRNMGQAGLCTAPQVDSLSPVNSTSEGVQANGNPSDIMVSLLSLLENKDDIRVEELLEKLQLLVMENSELKDTITQNNLALRQQMNLLVQWNQQVEHQQRLSRQEVNEARKYAFSMKQENDLLKSTLAGFKNPDPGSPKFQELDNTIQRLNEQLDLSEHKLQSSCDEKEVILSQRTKLEGELTLLKCDLTATRSEHERLQLQKQELVSIVKDLKEKLRSVEKQSGLQELYKNGDSSQETQQLIQKEREKTAALLRELQSSKNQVEYLEEELKLSRGETVKYKSKYQLSSKEIDSPTSESPMDRKNENPDLRRAKDEAAMLREEVDSLESALTEERKRTNEERTTLNRLQSENIRLKKELADTQDRTEKNHYNDQYYQTKIKSVQEMHDEATAKIISYEELLGSKNDEISRLKKDLGQTKAQLTELKSEGETIAVLRAQVEVYQSDFRAEREAREAMAADREKLREEIRHLHMRNTQLMDELDSYQRKHFNQGHGRSSRAGSEEPYAAQGPKDSKDPSSLSPEDIWDKISTGSDKKQGDDIKKEDAVEVDENLLYCPKCNKSFTELRPLEEHVNKCLDED